jgi:hypothetical protein
VSKCRSRQQHKLDHYAQFKIVAAVNSQTQVACNYCYSSLCISSACVPLHWLFSLTSQSYFGLSHNSGSRSLLSFNDCRRYHYSPWLVFESISASLNEEGQLAYFQYDVDSDSNPDVRHPKPGIARL